MIINNINTFLHTGDGESSAVLMEYIITRRMTYKTRSSNEHANTHCNYMATCPPWYILLKSLYSSNEFYHFIIF